MNNTLKNITKAFGLAVMVQIGFQSAFAHTHHDEKNQKTYSSHGKTININDSIHHTATFFETANTNDNQQELPLIVRYGVGYKSTDVEKVNDGRYNLTLKLSHNKLLVIKGLADKKDVKSIARAWEKEGLIDFEALLASNFFYLKQNFENDSYIEYEKLNADFEPALNIQDKFKHFMGIRGQLNAEIIAGIFFAANIDQINLIKLQPQIAPLFDKWNWDVKKFAIGNAGNGKTALYSNGILQTKSPLETKTTHVYMVDNIKSAYKEALKHCDFTAKSMGYNKALNIISF